MNLPTILIVAGPNGAGKTTVTQEYLNSEAAYHGFINADVIATSLSPSAPEEAAIRAGRIMLEEIQRRVQGRESFAFETTLSGKGYVRMIPRWRSLGYQVVLLYVRLDSVELSISRVRERVASGGHSIPEDVIRRRFPLSYRNFLQIYRPIVDRWIVYDNSGSHARIIESGVNP